MYAFLCDFFHSTLVNCAFQEVVHFILVVKFIVTKLYVIFFYPFNIFSRALAYVLITGDFCSFFIFDQSRERFLNIIESLKKAKHL